jgi:hypothetical protein
VYITTTLPMEETTSFWKKEYNLDKDIPDGID